MDLMLKDKNNPCNINIQGIPFDQSNIVYSHSMVAGGLELIS